MPVIAGNFISFVRNQTVNAAFAQLVFEFLPNPRILVDVFYHVLGAVLDLLSVAAELARRMER